MKKRRKFAPEFKAKVALEALAGELTLAELSAKHDIHPNVIQQWRRHAKESMADLFSGKAAAQQNSREAEIKSLHAKIGELTVEKDFLAKAFGR
jgi:transposase